MSLPEYAEHMIAVFTSGVVAGVIIGALGVIRGGR